MPDLTENVFEVYLTGAILPGFQRDDTIAALAKLLRVTEVQAAQRLNNQQTVIKRGLSDTQTAPYLLALSRAGVMADRRTTHIADAPPPPAATPQAKTMDLIAILGLEEAPSDAPSTAAAAAPITPPLAQAPITLEPAPPPETMQCPACDATQPKRTLCRQCGVDMPRMIAAKALALTEPVALAAGQPALPAHASAPRSIYASPLSQLDMHAMQHHQETPSPFSVSTDGRIGRVRYLAFQLAAYAPMTALVFLWALLFRNSFFGLALLMIGSVLTMFFWARASALRLHDLNFSGKWVLLPVLATLMLITGSVIAALVVFSLVSIASILLFVLPGSEDDNHYGSPAGPNTTATFIGAGLYGGLIALNILTALGTALPAYQHYVERSRTAAMLKQEQQQQEGQQWQQP